MNKRKTNSSKRQQNVTSGDLSNNTIMIIMVMPLAWLLVFVLIALIEYKAKKDTGKKTFFSNMIN